MLLPCQRQHFRIPSDITYLNCAYMGPLSHRVLAAGVEGLGRKTHPWKISPDDFFTDVERARELFAHLIGGDNEGVALLPSVSYGIACAARNVPLPAGGMKPGRGAARALCRRHWEWYNKGVWIYWRKSTGRGRPDSVPLMCYRL